MPVNVIEVAVQRRHGGEVTVNVFHLRKTLGVGEVNLAESLFLRDQFNAFWQLGTGNPAPARGLFQLMPSTVTMDSITVKDLEFGAIRTHLLGPNPGGDGGFPLPGMSAIITRLSTDINTRRFRGRLFLGPWTVNALSGDPNEVSAAYPQQIHNALADLNTRLRNDGLTKRFELVVYSRVADSAQIVRRVRTPNQFVTQRRRVKDIPPSTLLDDAV